jgi:flavin reductase (DIM6/NTAB) family NADH-FMN oxidoreductase RutF
MISGRDGDKFAALGLEPLESGVVEAPRVSGSAGYIECRVLDRISAGDHDLFVAEVVSIAADDESFEGHWNVEVDAGRLLHHLGADRYAGLAHQYRATVPEPEEE